MFCIKIIYEREKKKVRIEKWVLWPNVSYILDKVLRAVAARMYNQMSGSNSLCVICKEGILSGSIFREP